MPNKNDKYINIVNDTKAVVVDTSHKDMVGNMNNDNGNDESDNVPSIKNFLETLDQKYGNGLFTQYLDSFISQSIDVLDILILNNNDFERLGIDKIGITKKMIREAEKYKI